MSNGKLGWLFILSASTVFFSISCSPNREPRKIERAFYYWKSFLQLSSSEIAALDSLRVSKLYVKFFDVDWNDEKFEPMPVAILQSSNFKLKGKLEIIPTVFITNECIQKLDSSQVDLLSGNISRLIYQIDSVNHLQSAKEIQVDCDWTASTQTKYFALLKKIKQHFKDISLSATIRLHQVKFMSKTGVPPADKGLLMCYNMGNLKNPATNNSILETKELEKYIGNLSSYPLPLDVALPLFEWKVFFRNNVYSGLIQHLEDTLLKNSFTHRNNNNYIFLQDTTVNGYSFKKNDVLRIEQSDYQEIMNAASLISNRLKNADLTISFYHLDSVILKKYRMNELENIYNSLH